MKTCFAFLFFLKFEYSLSNFLSNISKSLYISHELIRSLIKLFCQTLANFFAGTIVFFVLKFCSLKSISFLF